MKNYYLTLLSIFLFPLFSSAQSNYKAGYVVTLKGDTVRGFIDYREWGSNPAAISFKTAIAETNPVKYTTAEINFFTISGIETYVRYSGPVSMNSIDISHLSYDRDTSFRNDVVFLKILQKGKNLELYSYTDNVKSRLFIGEAPAYTPQELIYRVYRSDATGLTKNEDTYMKQLYAFANKYQVLTPLLQTDIERMNYDGPSVLDIVSKINQVSATDKKEGANSAPAFNLFAGVAVNIVNFNTDAGSPFYTAGGRSNSSTGAAVSFGINIFANPNTRRLQFRIEAGVAQASFKSLYTSKVSPYVPFKASFDQTAISITPQIIYNFYGGDNLKIYGGFGVAITHFGYSNSYLGSQAQPNSAADVEKNEPYYFDTNDDSFVIKGGVQIGKHLGVFAQYLSSVHTTKGPYFQLSSSGEQAGLNYFF